jgi:hypothetical protein
MARKDIMTLRDELEEELQMMFDVEVTKRSGIKVKIGKGDVNLDWSGINE